MSPELFANYLGRTVGGCRIGRRIGAGGMGVVFEAHHLALDKRVALKLLMPHLAADSSFVKRFVSEARLAAQVEHPNIVQVLNVGQEGDVYFIVMQFVEGRSLAEFLSQGPLAPRDAVKIVIQAARGLAAAHRRGIIHRDVKPENILVDKAGAARIVDMGLSKSLAAAGAEVAGLTAPGMAMGTPNYISPEQATEARTADARTDVYSLGATLYHALVGAPPFDGPSAIAIINKHINQPLAPPSSRRANVPRKLDALIARMMAKDPAARIGTMDEVVAELKKFLAASGGVSAAALVPAAGPAGREATDETLPLAGARPEPAAPRRVPWKYVLLGAAGMLGALIFLGILAGLADPARKAFDAARAHAAANPEDYEGIRARYGEVIAKFPKSDWRFKAEEAVAALDQRLAEAADGARVDFARRAGPLEKAGDWQALEKLWQGFPAQFAETDAGQFAARQAEQARAARVAAAEQRRQDAAQKVLDELKLRAAPLEKASDWARLEPLWSSFPAEYKGTPAFHYATRQAENARIARRAAQEASASERSRLENAHKALVELNRRADPLEKAGNYAELERLWKSFPAEYKDTDAAALAARRADEARVANRARELFAALAEGGVEKAAGYLDPRKDPRGVRFGLFWVVAAMKIGKASPTDFKIEKLALDGPDKAALRAGFTVSFGAYKPAEKHALLQTWERFDGEWYLVDNQRPPDEPGPKGPANPKRPRPGDRPERPGKPEAFIGRMASWA